MTHYVYSELAQVERAALARGPRTRTGLPLRGLGDLTMDQMHVVLGVGSFVAGAVVMHLAHRFKVIR